MQVISVGRVSDERVAFSYEIPVVVFVPGKRALV